MALAPSQIAREAKRKAVREHPNAASVLGNRTASQLNKEELDNALIALGLDPVAVLPDIAAVRQAAGQCDNLTQGETMPADERPWPKTIGEASLIETEVQRIRREIGGAFSSGDFAGLETVLRSLVTEARKPAVQVEVIREIQVESVPGAPVHQARLTAGTATWRKLFGVPGAMGERTCGLWDGTHPHTPKVDPEYVFPQPQTAILLGQIARKRNVYLFGPPGTGKTEFAYQLAAKTGRPLALISCDEGTDAATLVGMTTPDPSGGVSWQDGQLVRAMRTPGCVVLIDEPSMARAGAIAVLHNVLEHRELYLPETGQLVRCAPGVLFLAADNTNGTGGGARKNFHGTHALGQPFLDRFGPMVQFAYLSEAKERDVLVARTGCTKELASLLVKAVQVTRAAAANQQLSQGVGLRRLVAWAEMLTDGVSPMEAFKAAVLDRAPEQDQETLRQQLSLTYNRQLVEQALNPGAASVQPQPNDPTLTNPTPAGRAAASDFTNAN